MTSEGTYTYTNNTENQLIEVRRVFDNTVIAYYTYGLKGWD